MEQLTALDASFLSMENKSTPMHIGAIYILNCSQIDKPLDFKAFCDHIESRLPYIPRFRQKLLDVPLQLNLPDWSDDPEFNLKNHLSHQQMSDTCDEDELLSIAAQFLSTSLERSHPLWEVRLVQGLNDPENLPNTSCAILAKIHYSTINDVTGEELMSTLLDFSPQPEKTPSPATWQPKPPPSQAQLIRSACNGVIHTPFKLATMAKKAVASAFYTLFIQQVKKTMFPGTFPHAPSTRLNQPVTGNRVYAYHEFPLDRLKNINRKAAGITLNDIVLTICSEVVLRFLQEQENQQTSECALVAFSPISVRSKRIDSPPGSELSALLLSLATTEPNLAKRLKRIHDNASASNIYGQAIAANRLTHLNPSAMVGLSARICTEFQLSHHQKPLFNLPITNIPGPENHLYFAGAQVDYQLASAPLFDGVGLAIMVMSYAEKITFTFTACPQIIPNVAALASGCNAVLNQLETDLELTDYGKLENVVEDEAVAATSKSLITGLSDVIMLFRSLLSSKTNKQHKSTKTILSSKNDK